MTFYNPKEEVLEVILTSHGKRKLSEGKWKPKYYSFFDSDVLYDSEYAGFSEDINEIKGRIQDSTLQMRPQSTKVDLASSIKMVGDSTTKLDTSFPLGTSELGSKYAPAWSFTALKGEMTAGNSYTEDSYLNTSNVPLLLSDVTYTTSIHTIESLTPEQARLEDEYREFEDGSVLVARKDFLIIDLSEYNVENMNENFDIEVYEVAEESSGVNVYIPKFFIDHPEPIVDGILLDNSSLPVIDESGIDTNYVDYYLDIDVDEEIDDTEVCKYIATDEQKRDEWRAKLSCSTAVDDPGGILYGDSDLFKEFC